MRSKIALRSELEEHTRRAATLDEHTRRTTALQHDIAMAQYNYFRSYEWQKLQKQRDRAFLVVCLAFFAVWALYMLLVTLAIFAFREYLIYTLIVDKMAGFLETYKYYNYIVIMIIMFVSPHLIYRRKPWPYIYAKYNPQSVEVAAKAGIELIPPEKPKPPLTAEAASEYLAETKRLREIIFFLAIAIQSLVIGLAGVPFFLFDVHKITFNPIIHLVINIMWFVGAISFLPSLIFRLITRWAGRGPPHA
jgi:hypothetical protein